MKISEIITNKYKLRIPKTVYYDLLADVQEAEEEQKPVIDKIRAEIEQITDTMGVSYNQYVSKIDVLQILDKYKSESEEKK